MNSQSPTAPGANIEVPSSERDVRALLEHIPDFVLEIDSEGRITYVNRARKEFAPLKVVGSHFLDWVHPEYRPLLAQALPEVFEQRRTTEYRLLTAGALDHPRWYSALVAPVIEDDRVVSAVVVARDIGAQKRAEQALEAAEGRWRALLDNIPDSVLLVSCTGEVLFANRTLSGRPTGELMGENVLEHVLPEDHAVALDAMRRVLDGRRPLSVDIRVVSPENDVRWLSCRVGVIQGAGQEKAFLVIGNDTTAQKAAEAEVERSEARLRQIIDLVPHMIFARTLEGRFQLVNRATAEAYGTTVAALTGKMLPAVHPSAAEVERYLSDDRQVHATNQPTFVPYKEFTDPGGGRRLLQTSKVPFTLRDSDEPLVLGVAVDVTEQQNALAALQQSEEKFRNLVENINDVIYTQDRDGVITYISPVVERIGFVKVADIVGRPFAQFVHPDDILTLLESRERTLAGHLEPAEFRVIGADGRVFNVRSSSSLLWENGALAGLTGVMTDLTSQRVSERALRESEERFRWLYNMAPLAIMACDMRGRIVDWNSHSGKLFGWRREEVTGKTFPSLAMPKASRTQVREVIRTLRRGETAWCVTENVARDGHSIVCEWHNCVRRDSDGKVTGVLSFGIDITERYRAEEQQRKLEEQIQHTQKLESLGVLAGGIAHDFNNLLVGIIGNADFALSDVPGTSPLREHLEDIASAAQRAAELCRQLLAYSGKGKFVVMPIDLATLVQEMTQLLQVTITNKATLVQRFSPGLPSMEADPTQIRQIVMNLVSNAAESFGERPGTVQVIVDAMECSPETFHDAYLQEPLPAGRYVFLEVGDNGGGMSEETQRKIFEPFFTTKFAGRGLGLAAVLGIVRSHRGAISVRSELRRGTYVRVYFPATSFQPVSEPSEPTRDDEWRGAGTVLVVDDEQRVLKTSAKMLARAGFEVVTAKNGREGVNLFRTHADKLSLVILDMTMPRLGGQETFQRIRAISAEVPILLSSGYNEQEALARFAGEGLAGFLQKPYTQNDLIRKVRGALERPPA